MFQTATFPAASIPSESTENTIIDRRKIWLISEQIHIVRMGSETSSKSVLSCFACWLFGQRIVSL